MKVTEDFIQKVESLPDDKVQLIFSLVDQFANVHLAQQTTAGPVLSQEEIDHLISDIRAGIVG
ncbi:MAG: hypothetical protein IJR58_08565 [Lachnospiraceae bacterium]|nr:hypothetical protein [Lachnospiraceae bacterium]